MALLEVDNLVKDFGGLRANDKISFRLEADELLGLIGPNGAGKTTLFNCLAGKYPVTSGRIVLAGEDITALGAPEVARRGLARTFQVYTAAGDLTVRENIMVGCFMRTASRREAREQADAILADLNLTVHAGSYVSELPVAAQKKVTMATALGTQPKLLLLDEVAAGLNPGEIEDIMASIRHIHHQLGVAIILIEHVMELVMRTSDRLIVLDSGRKIAEGLPAEIARNEQVIKADLGARDVNEHSGEGL